MIQNDCNLSSKTLLLLESLIRYYSTNISILTNIVNQKGLLSLRILDWLVTNYAKKNNIVYTLYKGDTITNFNVYLDYKNQLKAYSKKYFDPFCRRERIILDISNLSWKIISDDRSNTINHNPDNEIITTVGQLNFFKWLIENEVLQYTIQNIQKIDMDMITTLNNTKKNNKRAELSKCASKSVCSYDKHTVVTFH